MSLDDDVTKVGQIMDRLMPIVQRYMHHLMMRDGPTVTLSVTSNLATTLMAHALTVVDRHGGDADEMWRLLRAEIVAKASVLQAQAEENHTLQ